MAFTHRTDHTAPHQHDTVAQALECDQTAMDDYFAEQDQLSELAAERAYERSLEDACWAEHRAFEEWEAARGVVQFGDAMAMAEAGL